MNRNSIQYNFIFSDYTPVAFVKITFQNKFYRVLDLVYQNAFLLQFLPLKIVYFLGKNALKFNRRILRQDYYSNDFQKY